LARASKNVFTSAEAQLEVKQREQELAATKPTLQRAQAALNPNPVAIAIAQKQIEQENNAAQANINDLTREKEAIL
jgi:hypothetical protein